MWENAFNGSRFDCIINIFFLPFSPRNANRTQNEVEMYLNLLWKFLKPISFSLIGKEVNFAVLEGNIVLYGFITLLIGVIVSTSRW